MRIVTIDPHKKNLKEVIEKAKETHYVSIYNPPVMQTIGFMEENEALQRAKALIPLIDSTRNGFQGNPSKKKATTRASR